jgi:hypothetical protein
MSLPLVVAIPTNGACPVRRGTSRRRSRCDDHALRTIAASGNHSDDERLAREVVIIAEGTDEFDAHLAAI